MTTIFTYSYPTVPPALADLTPNMDGVDAGFALAMTAYSFNSGFGRALSMWVNIADINYQYGNSTVNHISFANWNTTNPNPDLYPTSGRGAGTIYGVGPDFNTSSNYWVFLNQKNGSIVTAPTVQNWGVWTIAHEIGHTLIGSGHPVEGTQDLRYTIMSYPNFHIKGGIKVPNPDVPIPLTPGMNDIATVQAVYGESKAQDGDTVYNFSDTQSYFGAIAPNKSVMTIWDRAGAEGGNDTIDASALATKVYIDLRDGHFSAIGTDKNTPLADGDNGNTDYNVGIAHGAEIENAKGGSDYLNGKEGDSSNISPRLSISQILFALSLSKGNLWFDKLTMSGVLLTFLVMDNFGLS